MLKPRHHQLTIDKRRPFVVYKARISYPYTPQSRPCSRQGATRDSALNVYPSEALLAQTTQQSGWYPSYMK